MTFWGIVLAVTLGALVVTPLAAIAADGIATLRAKTPIDREAEPLRMPRVQNDDIKRMRSYPEQPPTIPHHIDGYQVDRNGNRCLACHARTRVAESQAPMISITHHMDRDGQFLADVSPRRYFCNQCHVPQTEVAPLVDNTFIDIDTILKAEQLDRAKPTTTRGRSPDCDLLIPGDSEHRRLDAAQRAPFAPKKACTC